jgi:hypothetical protein
MKDGRPGSRSATSREAVPDWEPGRPAGKQSSGEIYDDIDRRIKPCSLDWCRRRSETTVPPPKASQLAERPLLLAGTGERGRYQFAADSITLDETSGPSQVLVRRRVSRSHGRL